MKRHDRSTYPAGLLLGAALAAILLVWMSLAGHGARHRAAERDVSEPLTSRADPLAMTAVSRRTPLARVPLEEPRAEVASNLTSPAARPAGDGVATLAVRVLRGDGSGISARVSLHRPHHQAVSDEGPHDMHAALALAFTDTDGTVRFEGLDPDVYLAYVDEIPSALVPPLSDARSIVVGDGHGFGDTVALEAGENERTFSLLAAAWIEGHVRDDAGHPVPDVPVCASLQDPTLRRDAHVRTGADGHYRISCPPGQQRVNVFLGRDHPWSDAARPSPLTVRVADGETARCDFELSRRGATVAGRVLDQDGMPMPELEVLAYYKPDQSHLPEEERSSFTLRDHALRTWTAADGRFELRGLPAARFGIQVGPDDYEPVGRGRLGMLVPRRLVDLSATDRADLGTITVHRSRPFRLEGRITLAKGSDAATSTDGLQLYAVHQAGPRRRSVREVRIPTRREESGELVFAWSCETPEEGVLLVVRGPQGGLAQHVVLPTPDGSEQAHIVFSCRPRGV